MIRINEENKQQQNTMQLGRVIPLGFGAIFVLMVGMGIATKISMNTLVETIDLVKQTYENSPVLVTDEGTKTVESIVSAINNIALNSQQISLNTKQQSVAIQQVVDAMNCLNQSAQDNASGISQIKTGTQQLNEAAQNLKAVV